MFTGDEFGDGANTILNCLQQQKIKASFFLTGKFYTNPLFRNIIRELKRGGHFLGGHSDQHLLYCDWNNRDSLLVSKTEFMQDLESNYAVMNQLGIPKKSAQFFLPPFEWYNDSISCWISQSGLQLVNYTPGTLSTSDYTWPSLTNYRSSKEIYQSVLAREEKFQEGLNGFILLFHIGTDPRRSDKFHPSLGSLLKELRKKGYQFKRIDELLLIQ